MRGILKSTLIEFGVLGFVILIGGFIFLLSDGLVVIRAHLTQIVQFWIWMPLYTTFIPRVVVHFWAGRQYRALKATNPTGVYRSTLFQRVQRYRQWHTITSITSLFYAAGFFISAWLAPPLAKWFLLVGLLPWIEIGVTIQAMRDYYADHSKMGWLYPAYVDYEAEGMPILEDPHAPDLGLADPA